MTATQQPTAAAKLTSKGTLAQELHARLEVAPEIRAITLVQPLLDIEATQSQGRSQDPPSRPMRTAAVR